MSICMVAATEYLPHSSYHFPKRPRLYDRVLHRYVCIEGADVLTLGPIYYV